MTSTATYSRGTAGRDELKCNTIGGFDGLAGVVREIRRERANVLLLDAGDTVSDTMTAVETKERLFPN